MVDAVAQGAGAGVARVRLGVALLVPPPLDAEIDGLRRALGDGTLGRMPAHLTLVPPVNVREDRLGEALAVLRRAAAATRPFTVTLGPPTTFLPDNPMLLPGRGRRRRRSGRCATGCSSTRSPGRSPGRSCPT